jgi:hypothetical protein
MRGDWPKRYTWGETFDRLGLKVHKDRRRSSEKPAVAKREVRE